MTKCNECDGRGWHVGECHPRETCGVCLGTGDDEVPKLRARLAEVERERDGLRLDLQAASETFGTQCGIIATFHRERDEAVVRGERAEAEVERCERERADRLADMATMAGHLSGCSHALGVEQWADMPAAIERLRAVAEAARAVVDDIDEHGEHHTGLVAALRDALAAHAQGADRKGEP